MKNENWAFPESELRSVHATNADGTMGEHKTPGSVHRALGAGAKKRDYSKIRVPVLALFEYPRFTDGPQKGGYQLKNDEERAAVRAFANATAAYVDRWVKHLMSDVPGVRIVDLPGAGHFIFLTQETKVLKEIRKFIEGL